MAVSTKELPHDILAEKSLIGCLIIDSSAIDQINDLRLEKEDFYHPQYATVYEAIKDLNMSSQPIDLITVCSKLNERGKLDQVGGQDAVLNLVEDQASSANVHAYAKTIKEKSILRNVIKTSNQVIEMGLTYTGNTSDFISEVETKFFKLTSQARVGGLRDLKTFLKMNLKELSDDSFKKGDIQGLPTGFGELDKRLLGLQAGQLIILAARPAMGKTTLALNLAVNICKNSNLPVAIFSLEMVATELSMKILSTESCVDFHRLRTRNYLDTDLRAMNLAVKELSNYPLFIEDRGDVNLIDIKSQSRKIKNEHGLGLIIIDYLQLMNSHSGKDTPREQQISEISRGLKNLAKELECPIIALSQLNRSLEARTDRRPMLSDLRESGAIEQDADVVLFVYRDEVYNKNSPEAGTAEVIIGKNRAGETGTAKLAWIPTQSKFSNLKF